MARRISFVGRLEGRALNVGREVVSVILRDLIIDGAPVRMFNASCTPHEAFSAVPSFFKGAIRGTGVMDGDKRGGIVLSDCADVELLPEDVSEVWILPEQISAGEHNLQRILP